MDKVAEKLLSKFRPAPLSLGMEVSDYSIKLALVRGGSADSLSLLDYAIIPLVAKETRDKSDPISIIKNILREKRLFTATEVKLVISGTELDSKRITLPFMPKEEIAQALGLEAKEHFLFNIEESKLDFEILQETTTKDGTKHIEVMATLAKNRLIDEKLSFVKDAQFPPSAVIPAAYCLYNLYRLYEKGESNQPVALIDIGASTTTVVIIKNNKISFIRQLGCAGKDFSNAMTGTLVSDKGKIELSSEKAEELKKQIGIPEESTQLTEEGISAQQLVSMVRPIIEKLTSEIKRSFSYYTSQFGGDRVTRVYLSGGTSKLKNIHTQLSQELSIPVESLGVPQGLKIKLIPERTDSFKEDFPILVAAIGAAISSPQGVNLIPTSYKLQRIKKMEKVSIRIIFIIISLIVLTSYLFNSAQEKVLRNLLAAKEPQYQQLQEVGALHSRITQKNTIIDHTFKNQVPLYYVFKALSNLIPRVVYLESLIIKDKASHLEMKGVVLETTEMAEVTLAEFIKALEDSQSFNNVLLVSSQDAEISGRQALEFEISCKL